MRPRSGFRSGAEGCGVRFSYASDGFSTNRWDRNATAPVVYRVMLVLYTRALSTIVHPRASPAPPRASSVPSRASPAPPAPRLCPLAPRLPPPPPPGASPPPPRLAWVKPTTARTTKRNIKRILGPPKRKCAFFFFETYSRERKETRSGGFPVFSCICGCDCGTARPSFSSCARVLDPTYVPRGRIIDVRQ